MSPTLGSDTRIVALGGGHGTATTLAALRQLTGHITAVVSVADDGGSSGRLRELFNTVALGDLRMCLVALAATDSVFASGFAHRFTEGELAGHPMGNIALAGLVEATGDLLSAVDAAADALGVVGHVLPATTEAVTLKAFAAGGEVAGQVAVSRAGRIHRVGLVPADAPTPPAVKTAIAAAHQVVIGPGSLYTSVLAATLPPAVLGALAQTKAQRVFVCNLRPQFPETAGYDVADHVAALRAHGVPLDVVVCDTRVGMPLGRIDARVVDAPLVGPDAGVHDPGRLAQVLKDLLA
jgi:uncharacterized cofD-like protein